VCGRSSRESEGGGWASVTCGAWVGKDVQNGVVVVQCGTMSLRAGYEHAMTVGRCGRYAEIGVNTAMTNTDDRELHGERGLVHGGAILTVCMCCIL
jgi:hypothetical protein